MAKMPMGDIRPTQQNDQLNKLRRLAGIPADINDFTARLQAKLDAEMKQLEKQIDAENERVERYIEEVSNTIDMKKLKATKKRASTTASYMKPSKRSKVTPLPDKPSMPRKKRAPKREASEFYSPAMPLKTKKEDAATLVVATSLTYLDRFKEKVKSAMTQFFETVGAATSRKSKNTNDAGSPQEPTA